MEHGKLSDRVERLATGLMNEHALLCDRPHHTVVDEIIHEVAGTPLVEVRRRNPGRIPVLCNEFGFEPFVVVCRAVEDIGSSPWELTLWTRFERAARLLAQTNSQAGEPTGGRPT